MNEVKLLTVIILTYNSEKYIEDTLISILNQSYSKLELIIADDSSSVFNENDLIDFIDKYKKNNLLEYTIYSNDKNVGTVKNLNKAISRAKGDYISAIAGDDVYYNEFALEKLVDNLEQNQELQLVAGKVLSCTDDLKIIKNDRLELSNMKVNKLIKKNENEIISYVFKRNINILATQACCFRNVFFKKHGLYDESYILLEDLPMMMRILSNKISFGYIDTYIVLHREGTGVSSTKDMIASKSYRYYLDMWIFFEDEVLRYEKLIGKFLVRNRVKLYKFRVLYAKSLVDKKKSVERFLLTLRFSITIGNYMILRKSRDIFNKLLLRWDL